ncbi:MAG: serine/threonine-protein kinase [Pseudomonadota bacterium]
MAERRLEKYTLLEEVGQGGMATVFRGIDTALNREVAVKILHQHLANQEESKQRFQREAQAVAKLRHENILEIYDYSGIESPESFIVTEFIHGQTLRDFMAENSPPHPEIAVMIVVEMCKALEHAHSLGVIHRDIKPENIMIRQDGRIKLTDFGIAQIVDIQRLTVTGQILGSPAYMAPELVEGGRVDFRTDLFSVGTLLYQMATGELPFQGKNAHEVLKRVADGRFLDPEIANPMIGKKLGRMIRKALARSPKDRYQTARELRTDLVDFLADVDVEDPRVELAAYFAYPREFGVQFQKRVVHSLTQRGKRALKTGNAPLALQHFDRVLCIDPNHTEVLRLLGQFSRQRRLRRVLLVILAGTFVGSSIYWVLPYFARQKGHTSVSSDAGVIRAALVTPDLSEDSGGHVGKSTNEDEELDGGVPGGSEKTHVLSRLRRVEIIPFPKAINIRLNGRDLGAYGPDLRFVTLPRGPAKLTFSNDACCFEKVVDVPPQKRLEVLRVKLPWKPGRVKAKVAPEVDADVVVGTSVGRAGQLLEVPIPSYSEDGRTEIEMKVSAPGFATVAQKVTVTANATVVVPVTLSKRLP